MSKEERLRKSMFLEKLQDLRNIKSVGYFNLLSEELTLRLRKEKGKLTEKKECREYFEYQLLPRVASAYKALMDRIPIIDTRKNDFGQNFTKNQAKQTALEEIKEKIGDPGNNWSFQDIYDFINERKTIIGQSTTHQNLFFKDDFVRKLVEELLEALKLVIELGSENKHQLDNSII